MNRSPNALHSIFLVSAFVIFLTGCANPLTEEKLIQSGIGTELYSEQLEESSDRLDTYLKYMCRQAGLPGCDYNNMSPRHWAVVVRAGFNDIDRRCDSYLAWLNSRRRNSKSVLSQISDTRTVTEALLEVTGVGLRAITVTGLAFGLAKNTFTNYYSRLLLSVEKSTVELVVHERRLRFREQISKRNFKVSYKPDAVHVLREYLLMCTPHNIENSINQRTRDSVAGNTPAEDNNTEHMRQAMLANAFISQTPQKAKSPLPEPKHDGPKVTGGQSDIEKSMPKEIGQLIQRNLCVAQTGHFAEKTRKAIRLAKVGMKAYLARKGGVSPFKNDTSSLVRNSIEAEVFKGANSCQFSIGGKKLGYENAYEKFRLPDEDSIKVFQKALKRCAGRVGEDAPEVQVDGLLGPKSRAAIKFVKDRLAHKKEIASEPGNHIGISSYREITGSPCNIETGQ